MKKSYRSPVFQVEEFAANEYVAACLGVACVGGAANKAEGDLYSDTPTGLQVNHNGGCQSASNNKITYMNGQYYVTEYNSAAFASSGSSIGSSVSVGDYVYWNTSATDGRVWHHQGTVTSGVNKS